MWADIHELYEASVRTDRRSLRNFGILVTVVLAAVGLLSLYKAVLRNHPSHLWFPLLLAAGLALFIALVLPKAFKPLYLAWMALAAVLGYFMTRIALGIVFFTLFSITGIVLWLLRRDPLDQRLGTAQSYWHKRRQRPIDRVFFEKQF
jgi:hypothetical protein